MDRIGDRLRRRREELGFTVGDIAEATKFRPEIIRAVEEGRSGVFPAEAYRKAFLRAYALRLNLDPEDIVRDQRSEEQRAQDAIRGLRLGPRRDINLKKAAILLSIAAVVVVAFLMLSGRIMRQAEVPEPGAVPVSSEAAETADSLGPEGSDLLGRAGESTPEGGEDTPAESEGGSGNSSITGFPDRPVERGPMTDAGTDGTLLAEGGTAVEGTQRGDDQGEEAVQSPPHGAADEDAAAAEDGRGENEHGAADRRAEDGAVVEEQIAVEEVVPVEVQVGAEQVPEEGRAGQSADRISKLELVVRRSAVVRLRSGDRVLVDGMLRSGYRAVFQSSEAFVVDHLTDRDAVVLLLDGQPVELPAPTDANDKVISEFVIPIRH
jgi:cytoskeleton protein RodZ